MVWVLIEMYFLDNVHFQNSAQLAGALIKEKVKFRTQVKFLFPFKVLFFLK